ncbi:hypothetical protein EYF80_002907 [Liparis tanakae]|uniref:Uncharacterized protein n=1 Tax=Liparis tanakae TaxID=230148 RepID=A0A4Z2JA94_9TELE|nr:hypothetical protein EYF80_002907 [Liparis tanakae]
MSTTTYETIVGICTEGQLYTFPFILHSPHLLPLVQYPDSNCSSLYPTTSTSTSTSTSTCP